MYFAFYFIYFVDFFFFKQKTAYEMRISDWSSDVCSSDLRTGRPRPTLAAYIDRPGFYPAGRLDLDSEGLLLLTDDGRLQARIADPRFKMPKTYLVQVVGDPDEAALAALRHGVRLKDGPNLPAQVERIEAPAPGPRAPPARFRSGGQRGGEEG